MAIPKPITRVEQYLAHISGMRVNVPEAPLTREERYLAAWAKKSGIEDAEIQGDPPLTLKDCIGEPFKGLTLYGKSTQVTTTGAQLLDKDALINGIIDLSSGVIYSNNAWVVSDFIPVSDLSNYCISQENEVFFQCRISCYDASKNKITADEKSGNVTFFTFSTPEATKYIRIGYSTQLSGNPVDRGNIMLNAGDTALPWEPYTGGKPSPSPDYPQEIQSAKGNVEVKGKNLVVPFEHTCKLEKNGMMLEYDKETQIIHVYGSCEKTADIYVSTQRIPFPKNVTVTVSYVLLSGTIPPGSVIQYSDFVTLGISCTSYVSSATGTWTKGDYPGYIRFAMNVPPTQNVDFKMRMQLEYGSEATDYEPCREPQTLTITSPTSLPGIPVYSGGNYTDEQGQQWICDEIDLERGVYVQRINELAFDQLPFSYEKTPVNHNDTFIASIDEQLSGTETGHAMCQYAFFDGVSYELAMQEDCRCYVWRNNVTIQFRDSVGVNTLETFAEWLSSHPNASISYVLATPIETPLSETDIAAYRALTTYRGTTILESECGLKVIYSKLRK